jgi:hypothetical protein
MACKSTSTGLPQDTGRDIPRVPVGVIPQCLLGKDISGMVVQRGRVAAKGTEAIIPLTTKV